MTLGKTHSASYGSWLSLFCVSVSWRVLIFYIEGKHIKHVPDALMPSVEHAERTWREYLLGKRPHPARHEQHFLPLGAIESATDFEMPPNINRYFLRAPDIDIVSGEKTAYVYSKLGPFVILGFIAVPFPKQWVGTKVHVQHGNTGPRDYVMPKEFAEYIMGKARRMAQTLERLSEKQEKKIDDALMANLARAASSDSIRAMSHDVRLFGRRAFTRK